MGNGLDSAEGSEGCLISQEQHEHVLAYIEAGYIWVNIPGGHALGVPYGGIKQSGIGREECLDELLSYTQLKSIRVRLPG